MHNTLRQHRHSRGFSLLEILVVVGILALLVTLSVIGFKVVGGTSRNRVTLTALENAKGLVTNYELTSSLTNLLDQGTVLAITNSPDSTHPRWLAPTGAASIDVTTCLAVTPLTTVSGTVEASADQRVASERYLRDETARVLRRLAAVPANRKALEAMPPDRTVKIRFPAVPNAAAKLSGGMNEYPLGGSPVLVEGLNMLDGEGHAIYFIPGGGLANVNVGYAGTGDRADKVNYNNQILVRAPDHKPFWASAGPDGDLTTGDDNVYSFEH